MPDRRVHWSSTAGEPLTGHVRALGYTDWEWSARVPTTPRGAA